MGTWPSLLVNLLYSILLEYLVHIYPQEVGNVQRHFASGQHSQICANAAYFVPVPVETHVTPGDLVRSSLHLTLFHQGC
jgi:hypothetical protein